MSEAAMKTGDDSALDAMVTPKLWAGKYKTPEELEEGYKNSLPVFNENKELKAKLANFSVPDDYQVPDDIQLRKNDLQEIKALAKNAEMTQEQFVKTAREMQQRIRSQIESVDLAKKELGSEKLNILSDYVEKNYPASLRETVLNKLIKDKDAMTDALNDRDKRLDSRAPGFTGGTAAQEKYDGQTELNKAAKEYHQRPNDRRARDRYIALASEVGNERFGKK